MGLMMLNGKKRCTLITRFDGSFLLIGPGGKEKIDSFRVMREVKAEVERRGWTIGFVHPTLKKAEEGESWR
jgi:hypothetical protein